MYSSILNRQPLLYKGVVEEKPLAYALSNNIVVDSIKRSLDKEGVVVRVYEGVGKEMKEEISISFPYAKAFECNMVEEDRKELETLSLSFSPFEIKTLYFKV